MQPTNPSHIDDDDQTHQKCAPTSLTTRSHAASGCTPFVSMGAVALSSLERCAKTYEVRHTPTPVRVTEALQAAGCGGCGTTREGKGGTSTGLGPQVQVQASSQPPGRSSGRPSWGIQPRTALELGGVLL